MSKTPYRIQLDPRTHRVPVLLSDEELKQLDARCTQEDMKRAELIRALITRGTLNDEQG